MTDAPKPIEPILKAASEPIKLSVSANQDEVHRLFRFLRDNQQRVFVLENATGTFNASGDGTVTFHFAPAPCDLRIISKSEDDLGTGEG